MMYILTAEKGGVAHVSGQRRRMLDSGDLCSGTGRRDSDRCNFPGRNPDDFGILPADRVRLRLLQAMKGGL